jgi:hypothetical protein
MVYLGLDCARIDTHSYAETYMGGITAQAGVNTGPQTMSGGPYFYSVTFDTSGLTVGENYHLCIDFDSVVATQRFGPSGFLVYMTPAEELYPDNNPMDGAVTIATDEVLDIYAPDIQVNNGQQPQAYLALACNTRVRDGGNSISPQIFSHTAMVDMVDHPDGTNGFKQITVDTSNLEPGMSYRLCIDMDGPVVSDAGVALPVGDAGFEIFATLIPSMQHPVFGGSYFAPVFAGTIASLELQCDNCTNETLVLLKREASSATACGEMSGPQSAFGLDMTASTTMVPSPRPGRYWFANFSTAGFPAGLRYALCADGDGSGTRLMYGDTGIMAYTHDVTDAQNSERLNSRSVIKSAARIINIDCASCIDGSSMAFLSKLPCNMIYNKVEKRNPRTDGYVDNAGAFHCFAEEVYVRTGSSPGEGLFQVTLNAGGLDFGVQYRLCIDYDGSRTTILPNGVEVSRGYGDSGMLIYVTAIAAVAPVRILPAPNQELRFTCLEFGGIQGCSNAITAYVAVECDVANRDKPVSASSTQTPQATFNPENPPALYNVFVDASTLIPGILYRFCVDQDGLNPIAAFEDNMQYGDLGYTIYVFGDTSLTHFAVYIKAGQTVTVTTAQVGANQTWFGFLGTSCGEPADASAFVAATAGLNSASAPFIFSSGRFSVTINAAALTPGKHYSLCADLDGPASAMPYGSTDLPVYASGVYSLLTPAVPKASAVTVSFNCTGGCTASTSLVFLAEDCDLTYTYDGAGVANKKQTFTFDGVIPAVDALSTAAVAISAAADGFSWVASLDTSMLTLGRSYAVCTDLDGTTTTQRSGNTDLKLYVSQVSALLDFRLERHGIQLLRMLCTGDCAGTSAYLHGFVQHGGVGVSEPHGTSCERR